MENCFFTLKKIGHPGQGFGIEIINIYYFIIIFPKWFFFFFLQHQILGKPAAEAPPFNPHQAPLIHPHHLLAHARHHPSGPYQAPPFWPVPGTTILACTRHHHSGPYQAPPKKFCENPLLSTQRSRGRIHFTVLKIKPVRPPDNGQKIVWAGSVPCRTGNFSSYLHITAYK